MKTLEIIYNDMDKQRLISKLAKLVITKPIRAEFSFFKGARSANQNRWYWLVVQTIIDHFVEHMGKQLTKRQVDAWLLDMFSPTETHEINGRVFASSKTTSQMDTMEMSQYMDKVDQYCANEIDLLIPKPEDLYGE